MPDLHSGRLRRGLGEGTDAVGNAIIRRVASYFPGLAQTASYGFELMSDRQICVVADAAQALLYTRQEFLALAGVVSVDGVRKLVASAQHHLWTRLHLFILEPARREKWAADPDAPEEDAIPGIDDGEWWTS